jgi:asparagine synthase (glutamine-hydrolysing)
MAQMQYADVETFLTDDILVKVDKASMFNSIETRAPLLDQYLVEYVASLPSTIRTHDGALKYLLKKVAADMLPAEIVTRPKQGFGVPIQHWLRADLANYAHELLDSPRAHQRGIFNPQFIRHLLKSHTHTKLINHSEAIWTLLCLELWFQTYMDQSSIEQCVATQAMSKR